MYWRTWIAIVTLSVASVSSAGDFLGFSGRNPYVGGPWSGDGGATTFANACWKTFSENPPPPPELRTKARMCTSLDILKERWKHETCQKKNQPCAAAGSFPGIGAGWVQPVFAPHQSGQYNEMDISGVSSGASLSCREWTSSDVGFRGLTVDKDLVLATQLCGGTGFDVACCEMDPWELWADEPNEMPWSDDLIEKWRDEFKKALEGTD